MRAALIFVVLLLGLNICRSQDFKLMAFIIDSTLTENADAVIRYHHTRIRRTSLKKAVVEVEYAVTIMNRNGNKHAWLVVPYNNHKQVQKIEGSFYNSLGIKTREVDKNDIKDYSAYADYTFFSDSRVKAVKVTSDDYPFTMVYKYKIRMNGLVGFDTWMPVRYPRLALEYASLKTETPEELSIRYKTSNSDIDFETVSEDGSIRYEWQLENVAAYTEEPFMPPKGRFLPWVALAPNDFEYDRTTGNFETWQHYGKWSYALQRSRGNIPPETIALIAELTVDDTSALQTIEKVYRFVQQNTRYVNISLGIGGFQPMDARDVAETGYGDCKALTNYTKACLAAAGIESWYAEIISDKSPRRIDTAFTSINQTNHVILCVPQPDDTLWLECTNPDIPPGFIGRYNSNRNALLVTPEGGKIVNTPEYTYLDNKTISTLDFSIDGYGGLTGNADFAFTGNNCGRFSSLLKLSGREQRQWLLRHYLPNDLRLKNFGASAANDSGYRVNLNLEVQKDKFAKQAGKRLIFQPLVFQGTNTELPGDTARKHDFYIKMGETRSDTINYNLPANYKIEYLPESISASCRAGSYKLEVEQNPGCVKLIRQFILKQGLYPVSGYPEIYEFFKTVSEGNRSSVVLKQTD